MNDLEIRKGWHKHTNGGGWVEDTAKIDLSVYVGPNAQVSGNARVYGNAWVSGNARVSGNAWVSGNARVSGDARVSGNAQVSGDARVSGDAWAYGDARVYGDAWAYGNARVYGNAWVSGNARVSGDAQVSGNARVYGNAWVFTPLFIAGSKQGVSHAALGVIQIGCETRPIEWWLANADSIGKEHGYNEHEIAEYKQYLNLIAWRDAQIKELNLVSATVLTDKAA